MIPAKEEMGGPSIFDAPMVPGQQDPMALQQPVPVASAPPALMSAPPAGGLGHPMGDVVVVQAVGVPTTKKPSTSREAIVIGMANNPESWQVPMKDAICKEPCYFFAGALTCV
jgi:hypothetical protein